MLEHLQDEATKLLDKVQDSEAKSAANFSELEVTFNVAAAAQKVAAQQLDAGSVRMQTGVALITDCIRNSLNPHRFLQYKGCQKRKFCGYKMSSRPPYWGWIMNLLLGVYHGFKITLLLHQHTHVQYSLSGVKLKIIISCIWIWWQMHNIAHIVSHFLNVVSHLATRWRRTRISRHCTIYGEKCHVFYRRRKDESGSAP